MASYLRFPPVVHWILKSRLTKSPDVCVPVGCLSITSRSFESLYNIQVIINSNVLNTVIIIAILTVSVKLIIDHGYITVS